MNELVTNALKGIGASVSYLMNIEPVKPDQYIVFTNLTSVPAVEADDMCLLREFEVQVDIYSKFGLSYTALMKEVIERMEKAGFTATDGPEILETENLLIHKVLQFKYYQKHYF